MTPRRGVPGPRKDDQGYTIFLATPSPQSHLAEEATPLPADPDERRAGEAAEEGPQHLGRLRQELAGNRQHECQIDVSLEDLNLGASKQADK